MTLAERMLKCETGDRIPVRTKEKGFEFTIHCKRSGPLRGFATTPRGRHTMLTEDAIRDWADGLEFQP